MIFGTIEGKPWVEALPTKHGTPFTGRTFSRVQIVGDRKSIPTIGEIWATSDHAVEQHVHDSDEMFYILSGAIEINGRRLGANDAVFIPRGTSYSARVLADEGSHVLRIEFPNANTIEEEPEYSASVWTGPLTAEGAPDLDANPVKGIPT